MLALRPHHVLDIVRNIGQGRSLEAHPLGHDQHGVTARILADPRQELRLVVGADDICGPCSKLGAGGLCSDVLAQLEDRPSKQRYNDELDARILAFLGLKAGDSLLLGEYLGLAGRDLAGLARLCAHPGEDPERRLEGLRKGLARLGA